MSTPTRLNTPNLHKMIVDIEDEEFIARMKHDEKTLGDDWINSDEEVCTKCAGTGRSPMHLNHRNVKVAREQEFGILCTMEYPMGYPMHIQMSTV